MYAASAVPAGMAVAENGCGIVFRNRRRASRNVANERTKQDIFMKIRDRVQNFGRALSSMVMPNIGAFIAWGLLTALFIPTGWWPNERLNELVGPMLTYLLPLLIGYTAGSNMAGARGGVAAAIATSGVIVGSEVPMFIGAMIIGPVAGWVVKRFDRLVEGRVRAGFEMLVNNFSVGIIGMLLAIFGYYTIGSVVTSLTVLLSSGVEAMMNRHLLPLVAIFVEPAKVLFLNNAINHGIFSPIGIAQAKAFGESIMFLLETNPGPGLGVLLAYWAFGRGAARSSAPGAALIHFFGGIHEIYFPYILARPILIVAPILGSASAILFYSLFDAGLIAPASPGSIISVLAMAPKGKTFIVLLGVIISAAVSFIVAAPFVRRASAENETLPENKYKPAYKRQAEAEAAAKRNANAAAKPIGEVRHIVFSCDAGMGSSALGATRFRKRIEPLGLPVRVTNSPVNAVPADADIVVCQGILAPRAKASAPTARIVEISNFLQDPALDGLYDELNGIGAAPTSAAESAPAETVAEKTAEPQPGAAEFPILNEKCILLGAKAADRWTAIREAGRLLAESGYVDGEYVEAMVEREKIATTYLGVGVAIPHGTADAKSKVLHTGISVVQYPDGVEFGDEQAQLVIGIAGVGDEHLEMLARVSEALEDEEVLERLKTTSDTNDILNVLK